MYVRPHTHNIITSSAKTALFKAVIFFFIAKGGVAVSCKHNGIIDLLIALSQAVNSTTTRYNKTPGSVVQDMHNDSAMEFFCLFLPLLLALRIRSAQAAPDFSRKCFVFHINNCIFRTKSKC